MWGPQGWPQWPIQQAMYNDIPHEKIDWAELAKQWIQMKQDPPPPGFAYKKDTYATSGLVFDKYQTRENFTRPKKIPYMPKPPDSNFWGKPHWEDPNSEDIDERMWGNAPVVEPPVPMLGKETFDYGHVRDNPPLAMQSIDYNHMSEFSYNSVYPPPLPETHYDQYWSQINVQPAISPMFLKKERSSNHHAEEETNQLDAAKRKSLPAWIRDGLEKMEQERLKRLEKEREAKESAEKAAKSAVKKDLNEESSLIPAKSKFDSDSEAEDTREESVERRRSLSAEKPPLSPVVEDLRTEEEKKLDLMTKVRRTLTEVLLSVTTSEMIAIAQDVLKKAMLKAPARQLASSSSLSTVASGLSGLASYGTESEASQGESEEDEPVDSDEELDRKIREKKRLFALKERKIIAELEEEEKMNNEKKSNKERASLEQKELSNNIKTNTLSPERETLASENLTKLEDSKEGKHEEAPVEIPDKSNPKSTPKVKSVSSDSSSSSSESESESSEKHKKKASKDSKKSKTETNKKDKKSSSSKKNSRRSHDSNSPDKRSRRERSRDRKTKKKKSKRSDSSSDSSSSSHRKSKRRHESSRSDHKDSSRNRSREDRKRKRSSSPSKRSSRKSDGHSSSRRHDEDKPSRRHKEDRRHRRSRSESPAIRRIFPQTSKVPRKYRSSRSLSSESEGSGKKSKKSRNR